MKIPIDLSESFLIEFAGMPGVGKSFLSKRLFDQITLENKNIFLNTHITDYRNNKSRLLFKLRLFILLFLRYPRSFIVAFVSTRNYPIKYKLSLILNWIVAIGSIKLNLHYSKIILDQGLVQMLWSSIYRYPGISDSDAIKSIDTVLDFLKIDQVSVLWIESPQALESYIRRHNQLKLNYTLKDREKILSTSRRIKNIIFNSSRIKAFEIQNIIPVY